jgi:gliding motility-associated lipoprotein GldD
MERLKGSSLVAMMILMSLCTSCRNVVIPRPKGYFRIDLPEKNYIKFNDQSDVKNGMPFSFEYPSYGNLSFNVDNRNEPGWFNIEFPRYKARIYLTYKEIDNNFDGLMEQTYKMNVKNHISKADAIDEKIFNNQVNKVYGILYDLKGNTASAVQFYVTDSTRHYLRGSLYFSAEPDADSLAPVIGFFRDDIIHLIETVKWKK